jgi:hypothetical protein
MENAREQRSYDLELVDRLRRWMHESQVGTQRRLSPSG